MKKEKIIKILDSIKNELDISYNEGIQNIDYETGNRIVFWDYVWEPVVSSGKEYDTMVTYQFSFFSIEIPRNNQALQKFLNQIKNDNINPIIYHEYNENAKEWHSYFSLEIMEDLWQSM